MSVLLKLKTINQEQSRQIKELLQVTKSLLGMLGVKVKAEDYDFPSDEEHRELANRSGTEVGDQVTIRGHEPGARNEAHGELIDDVPHYEGHRRMRVTSSSPINPTGGHIPLGNTYIVESAVHPKGKGPGYRGNQ